MNNILSIFFLIASILSCIKILSTKSVSSSLIPFIMVISIGIILDLIEELKRYRNDILTNSTIAKVYKSQKFRNVKWSDIKVGNLIKVKKNEIIPADLLVICSSNIDGTYYLQTSNLDGESNLKESEAISDTQKIFLNKKIPKDENNLKKIFQENCEIEVDEPNKDIYLIKGNICIENNKTSFEIKNCAVRGARLCNTKFIYGIVIYTGKDTKIMMNIIKYKTKSAYLDKLVDIIVVIIIIIRIIYVIIFMFIGIYYRDKYLPSYDGTKIEYDYLYYYRHSNGVNEKNNTLEKIKFFTSHFILTQTLLPTSVAVLLALTKVIQSIFIEFLETSLRKNKNEKMKCFSNELLGELGSVKYIFSDKTGTLTKNQTQFKACSIYTSLFDEANSNKTSNNFLDNNKNSNNNTNRPLISKSYSNFSLTFNSENLLQRLNLKNIPLNIKNIDGCPFQSQGEALEEFVLNMALNHNIVVENNKNKGNIKYQGTNPDEITLVGAAQELGFCYLGKDRNILSVERKLFLENNENNIIKEYELLIKFPFCSEKQRSSIIVRDLKTNKIKLYIKGSDTKIFEGINPYSQENIYEITKNHVDDFAKRGLRTLCYSFKTIPDKEYNEWFLKYKSAKENINIDKEQYQQNLDILQEEIEKNCFLLGATALEDQLQDDVEKDVGEFIDAGINFWMLTGDKMDTAESIGNSIKLFDSDTEIFKIKGNNSKEIIDNLEEIKKKIEEIKNDLSNFNIDDDHNKIEDLNKKVDNLKEKMKNKVENIYEEDGEKEQDNIEKKGDEKSVQNESNISYLNNKNVDKIKILDNNNNKKKNNNVSIEKSSRTSKKRNSIRNMSILKFMIDDQFLKNNNDEYENLSILKGKIIKPSLEFSSISVYSKDQYKNNIIKNHKDSHINDNNNLNNNCNTIPIINISKKINQNNNEENSIVKVDTSKENIDIIENGIYNKIKIGDEFENKESSVNEILKKNENGNDNNKCNSNNKLKKIHRLQVNLPTNAQKFLEYFDTCLNQIKQSLYIQKNALFLFKLPYLYTPINKDVNNLNENMKKINWKEKFKLKSYLLHTKIKYSLIINGKNINDCISEGRAAELFWYLIENSRSVICCRCSPTEKSKIVEFVRNNSKEITLAIGDGENDVNMIKSANVGIGIFGKEGSQAAFNSDYAFYQFKYLKRLLFNNGRFTLLRNTYFLNLFFFKNFFYTLEPMIFSFFSLYSGTFFYDEFYDSMFNTFVSIIPLILFSIIDEDIDLDFQNYDEKKKKWMLYILPDMYKNTRDSKPFNIIKYIICTFISIIYAILIFLLFSFVYIDMIKNKRGETITYYELIFHVYFSIVFIHFFMVYIDTSLFNYLILIFFIAQILADCLFVIIFNKISNDNKLSGIAGEIFHLDVSFLTWLINCSICCLPFYILRRAELYFGINYSNLIKINRLEAIYFGNYYKKEIQRMITATRAIAKFKRIHKEFIIDKKPTTKYENLNDLKMIKVIERWEIEKQKKRK